MLLNDSDYDILFPKLNIEDYELRIKEGRDVAKSISCLIYSMREINSALLQSTQELFLYSEFRLDLTPAEGFDWLLLVDHRVRWYSTDGILNSLGYLSTLNYQACFGIFYQKIFNKWRILNRGVLLDNQRISKNAPLGAGDFPFEVKNWGYGISLHKLEDYSPKKMGKCIIIIQV